ncbi:MULTISPECIES: tetratricopeptide repeat protein [unclassified Sinorhizobium]|uniref:CHAT domain-containing protein n=1 Tax=unclassified Sinorhizobium TaxID=2613772 RepID=UPI0024C322AC|nr:MULTISPECIES: tetratricopeptide repeat protein [unclassified Sinorhizobium]MDK1376429.1 tetratricopeptide repeat protein [Sinorhizobium sp. 6-70]MDK1479978.1 tetratricopeptide repeat protein [Sinorhizobium sp. 6-117]
MSNVRCMFVASVFALLALPGAAQETDDPAIQQAREFTNQGAYRGSLSILDRATTVRPVDRRAVAAIRAENLLGQGRFEEASASAQAALEASTDLSKEELADTLLLIARIAVTREPPQTEALERALVAALTADGPDGLRTLRVKDRMALALSTARADEAERIERDVIAKAGLLGGKSKRDLLRFQNTLGVILLRQSKFAPARDMLKVAYEGRRGLLSETHPETLESEHNLGFALRRLGETQQADTILEEVRRLRIQVLGADHPDTLVTRSLIVRQMIDKSQFEPALSEMGDITAALTARFGAKNMRTIEAMSDMASVLFRVGRASEAIDMGNRAYSLAVEVAGEKMPATMNIGHEYAGLLYQTGRYGDALAVYQRILRATRALFDDENIDTIATLHNIAAVLSDLGRNDEAIVAYRHIDAVLAKKLPESHPSRLSVLNNLAQALRNADRYDEALEIITQVVGRRTAVLGAENQLTLLSRSNQAAVLDALGRYSEAITAHRDVYAIRARKFGETHPDTLKSLHNLASTLADAGQWAEARKLFEQVIALRTQRLGARNIDTVVSMRGLAGLLAANGNLDEARTLYRSIVDAAEGLRSDGGLPDTLRRSFFSTITPAYKSLAVLEASHGDFDAALRAAELSKARTLIETSSVRGTARNALPQTDQAALSDLEFRISQLDGRIPLVTDLVLRADLEAERNELAASFSALEASYRLKYPLYREAADFRLTDADAAAALLSEEGVILDFVQASSDLLLIWIDGKGRRGALVLPPYPNLPATLEAYRAALAIADGVSGLRYPPPGMPRKLIWKLRDGSYLLQLVEEGAVDGATLVSDIEEIRKDLSSWFLSALPAEVREARRWYVSPDGPLASIPLDTLRSNGAFLIETHDISSIQSISLMALSRDRLRRYAGLDRSQMLAIGNPQYSVGSSPGVAVTGIDAMTAASTLPTGQVSWPDLPGSAKELQGLASLFVLKPGHDLFSGQGASETNIRRLQGEGALQRFRYVIFSTHGYLDQRNPELSGIVLSQANLADGQDGYLRASELAAFDFRSDLVFISGCETGVGKWVSGEGLLGLPYSLFAAGNASTILTLWPIQDDSTAEFVEHFFRKLKDGKTPGIALSETKREFILGDIESRRTAIVWAPFVYYGE